MCYARHHVTRQWYLFDDSRVTPVTLDKVLSQEAYVLMYLRSQDPFHASPLLIREQHRLITRAIRSSSLSVANPIPSDIPDKKDEATKKERRNDLCVYNDINEDTRREALAIYHSIAQGGTKTIGDYIRRLLSCSPVSSTIHDSPSHPSNSSNHVYSHEDNGKEKSTTITMSNKGIIPIRSSSPRPLSPWDIISTGLVPRSTLSQLQRTQLQHIQTGFTRRKELCRLAASSLSTRRRKGTRHPHSHGSSSTLPTAPHAPLADDLDLPIRYVSAAWARSALLSPMTCGPLDNRDLCCPHGVPDSFPLAGSIRALAITQDAFNMLHRLVGGGPEVDGKYRRCHDCAYITTVECDYNRICALWNRRNQGAWCCIPIKWFTVRLCFPLCLSPSNLIWVSISFHCLFFNKHLLHRVYHSVPLSNTLTFRALTPPCPSLAMETVHRSPFDSCPSRPIRLFWLTGS